MSSSSGAGLLEEPRPRVDGRLLRAQGLYGLPRGVREPLGDDDGDLGEQVTGAVPTLHPTTLHAQHPAAGRARCDLDAHRRAVEGGHRHGGPEGGFGERHGQLDGEVVTVPAEDRVLLDGDGEDEVAAGRAGIALAALAAQPDLLAVLDAGRDLRRDATPLGGRQRDGRSLDGVAEAQGGPGLDVGSGPGAPWRSEPGERVGATTRGTRCATEHLREEVVEVLLATGPRTSGASRGEPDARPARTRAERAEDVLESSACAARATGPESCPTASHLADGVVLLTLLGVGEDRVGLSDVLEAALRRGVSRVLVRVVLAGESAVRLLDGRGVGVLGDAEDRVEVLLEPVLAGHRRLLSLPRRSRRQAGSATATRAGRSTCSPARYPGWSTVTTVVAVTPPGSSTSSVGHGACMSASCCIGSNCSPLVPKRCRPYLPRVASSLSAMAAKGPSVRSPWSLAAWMSSRTGRTDSSTSRTARSWTSARSRSTRRL